LLGRSLLRPLLGAFACLALTFAAQGQPATSAAASLGPDTVVSFIASFPEVRSKTDQLSAMYDVPGGGQAGSAWQAWGAVAGAKAELDAVVGAHGFTDFHSWTQVLSAVAQAYAFAREGGALDSQMAEALEAIRDNPNIPAAQKEMMLQQLQHSSAAIAGIRPPQEHIDAVTPHIESLAIIFEDSG
jgi:hypothetical protein